MRARPLFLTCALFAEVVTAAAAEDGVHCNASVPYQPTLRQGGNAEAVGDILLSCTSSQRGLQTLYLSLTQFASRQLAEVPPWNSWTSATEAALLINDCTSNSGVSRTGASCSTNGTFQGANPVQGLSSGEVLSESRRGRRWSGTGSGTRAGTKGFV